jgi:hypothetical protein
MKTRFLGFRIQLLEHFSTIPRYFGFLLFSLFAIAMFLTDLGKESRIENEWQKVTARIVSIDRRGDIQIIFYNKEGKQQLAEASVFKKTRFIYSKNQILTAYYNPSQPDKAYIPNKWWSWARSVFLIYGLVVIWFFIAIPIYKASQVYQKISKKSRL